MDFADIFEASSTIQSILSYTGMIANQEQAALLKLQRLAESELEAGIRSLEQAQRSVTEANSLIREARNRFNKAVSLEVGLRLAHAHLGLAICHANLGDGENAWISLNDLLMVKRDKYSEIMGYVKSVGAATVGTLATAFFGVGYLGGAAGYRLGQKMAAAEREAVIQERKSLAGMKRATWRYLHPGLTRKTE